MTIDTATNTVSYTGDGVSVAFPFAAPFIVPADLKVYVAGVLQATSAYVVTGTVPTTGSGAYSSGTVTFVSAPASLAAVQIICDPDQLQGTSLPSNNPFPAKTVERMADKLTLLIQRLTAKFLRAVVAPDGETGTTLTLPSAASRANNILTFDASGNVTTSAPAAGTATALALNLLNAASVSLGPAMVGYGDSLAYAAGTVGGALRLRPVFVNSITALKALLKTGTPVAAVTGYYAAGDGGGGIYCYDSTDTTSSDNSGTIIVASDGGRWKLQNTTLGVSVKQFGAKGNAKVVTDGAITSGLTAFTSATAAFTSADVGKVMSVAGAGAAGALLLTTISAFVSATQVTVALAAGTTVSGAQSAFGTDDSTAIQAALTNAYNVYLPNGLFGTSTTLTFTAQNASAMAGRLIFGAGQGDTFGAFTHGSAIWLFSSNDGLKSTDTLPYVTMRDFSVLGNSTSGRGVWFTGTDACSNFENLGFYTGKQAIYMPNVGGFGSSFANLFTNCHGSSYTTNVFEVAGGPGTTFLSCYAHNFPAATCGFRVYAMATLIGCNSVDAGTTCAVVGLSTLAGGTIPADATSSDAYVNFLGCNFETFTTAGVECRNGGVVTFRDCMFVGSGAYTASIIQNFSSASAQPIVIDRCTFTNSIANFNPYSGTIWQATNFYPVGAIVQNDTPKRLYLCKTAGTSAGATGPTGTGTAIADGTCTWDYLVPAAASRTKRSELYVTNGGISNYQVANCPSLGTKPQSDFGGVAIHNVGGSGSLVNLDGVNFVTPKNADMVHGPLVLAGPAVAAIGVATSTTVLGNGTATTVGAAGGASALPATPLGYIRGFVGGTAVKIPYYNN